MDTPDEENCYIIFGYFEIFDFFANSNISNFRRCPMGNDDEDLLPCECLFQVRFFRRMRSWKHDFPEEIRNFRTFSFEKIEIS